MLVDLGMPLMALITFYGNLSLLGNKINVQMVFCSSNLMHFPTTDKESCDVLILFKSCHHPWFSSPMGGLFVFHNSGGNSLFDSKICILWLDIPFWFWFSGDFFWAVLHPFIGLSEKCWSGVSNCMIIFKKHPSHYVFCWYLVCRMFCPFSFTVQLLATCHFELNMLKWLQSGGLGVL